MERGPLAEKTGVGSLLTVEGRGVTSGIRTKPRRVWSHVRAHPNMDNDLGAQRRRCIL